MVNRCNNKANAAYGGRGIKVLWNSFEDFRDDMYESYIAHVAKHGEKNTSIDRINNDGNYSKENCRWATYLVQSNNRRGLHFFEMEGERNTITRWSERYGIREKLVHSRLSRGWDTEKAIKEEARPVRQRIVQSDKNGVLIRIWDSIEEATEHMDPNNQYSSRTSITSVAAGRQKQYKGFKWAYADQEPPEISQKTCELCKQSFRPAKPTRKFCSTSCASRWKIMQGITRAPLNKHLQRRTEAETAITQEINKIEV